MNPWLNPMPGMILISSAASRPARVIWLIIWLFSVVLAWPVSTGTIISEADTTVTSCLAPRTLRVMFGSVALAPCVITMPFPSQLVKPGAVTVPCRSRAGPPGSRISPLLFVTVSRVVFVSSLFNTTLALGITAPLAS